MLVDQLYVTEISTRDNNFTEYTVEESRIKNQNHILESKNEEHLIVAYSLMNQTSASSVNVK